MKKFFLKTIGLLLVIFGVIIPAFLAISKTISETLFGLLFLSFLAAGFLIYKMDEIIEFEIKGLKLKTLQKEIYAKTEELIILSKKVEKDSNEIEKLKLDVKDLIRGYIETYAFDLSTRNMIPTPQVVIKKAEHELNSLLQKFIPNNNERKQFTDNLKNQIYQGKL